MVSECYKVRTVKTVWRYVDSRLGNPYGPTLKQENPDRATPQDFRDGNVRIVEGPPVKLPTPLPPCRCGETGTDEDLRALTVHCIGCGVSRTADHSKGADDGE